MKLTTDIATKARYLSRAIYSLGKNTAWPAACALAVMMLLTTSDVIGRYFDHPIYGSFEVVAYSGSVAAALAIAYTQSERGHVAVDFLVRRLPQRVQAAIDSITYLISAGLFSLIAFNSYLFGTTLLNSGVVTSSLKIPFGFFAYGVTFGCAIMCLVLLVDFSNSVARAVKR